MNNPSAEVEELANIIESAYEEFEHTKTSLCKKDFMAKRLLDLGYRRPPDALCHPGILSTETLKEMKTRAIDKTFEKVFINPPDAEHVDKHVNKVNLQANLHVDKSDADTGDITKSSYPEYPRPKDMAKDASVYGVYIEKDGKRIDPKDYYKSWKVSPATGYDLDGNAIKHEIQGQKYPNVFGTGQHDHTGKMPESQAAMLTAISKIVREHISYEGNGRWILHNNGEYRIPNAIYDLLVNHQSAVSFEEIYEVLGQYWNVSRSSAGRWLNL